MDHSAVQTTRRIISLVLWEWSRSSAKQKKQKQDNYIYKYKLFEHVDFL